MTVRESMAPVLARGITRHLMRRGLVAVQEFTLPNSRRADLFALSQKGEIWIVEIKSSVEDFRADHKWQDYRPYCDRLYFGTHADMPLDIFPEDAGLIVADAFDAEMLRDSPAATLNPATRKALLIQMAQLSAARLTGLIDPDFRFGR